MDDTRILETLVRVLDILAATARFPHTMDFFEAGWSRARGAYVASHPHNGHVRSAHQVLHDADRVQAALGDALPLLTELGPALEGHPSTGPFLESASDPGFSLRVLDAQHEPDTWSKGFQVRLGRFDNAKSSPSRHTRGHVLTTLATALATAPTEVDNITATEETTSGIVGQGTVPLSVLETLWPVFVRTSKPNLDPERYGYRMGLWVAMPDPKGVPLEGAVLIHNGAGNDFSMRRWVDKDAEQGSGEHHTMVHMFVTAVSASLVQNATTWVPHPSMPEGRIRKPGF